MQVKSQEQYRSIGMHKRKPKAESNISIRHGPGTSLKVKTYLQ